MNLPRPPAQYDIRDQEDTRGSLEREDRQNRKKGQDVELEPGVKLVKRSPNGTRWSIEVDDAGVISATALP